MPITDTGIDVRDDQRRAEVAQEREDDQHDEDAAEQRVLLHVVDRALDEDRLVVGHQHADAGHLAVDPLDFGADAFGDRDRVLFRLLVDRHPDARLAVDAHELPAVLGGVDDLGDVAQVDRHAVARQHDEVADVVEVGELALAADQVGRVALRHLAERRVLVLLPQRLDDAIDREVERRDLFLRQLDVNLAAQAAVDRHRRDARARARAGW